MALLAGVLTLALTGCTRVVVDGSSNGYGSGVDDRVSVQRGAEGSLGSEVREILIENQFGPVVVEGTDGDLGWSWKLACWGKDTAEAEAQANRWRMETTTAGSRAQFRLATDSSSRTRLRIESELRLRAPRTASVEILNSFGEVQVRTLEGTARIRAQNGRVSLEEVRGAIKVATSFAPLDVEAVGAAKLDNQNGAVRVAHVAGTLVARTSFAELTAESVRGKATLRNQNGTIQAS